MEKPEEIVIASQNQNKINEIEEALAKFSVKVTSLNDYSEVGEIDENGSSFEENAEIKARAVMNLVNKPVIADDSGLVVPALNGAPGIHSARYAGDHDDDANNRKLIKELAGKNREAYFESVLVFLTPAGDKVVAEGKVDGEILTESRGDNGFGYDPFFLIPGSQKTMAEMSIHEKNAVSHRGRAIKQLVAKLSEAWS
ncbi:non-canonical purine NTP pyrophosphatase [Lentilactobacillus curieae]|uniref:dITP/XTP pyrophosphatase n=1 Tax=Lentilactobacillus curieae TaxID=1138822 RepID=A0A1S6QKU3_9LACO|nr:XTP/dITP diphosphatase [Lentilactobacillus curieae]AQW22193.1 non-canonical purine NTP pyrophosphatase [Lentilactobacillus curieae]